MCVTQTMPWIVKPSTSSQGKGIFITRHSAMASSGTMNLEDETCTVSRYAIVWLCVGLWL